MKNEKKTFTANNSVIEVTDVSIRLWKDGERKFIATKHTIGCYYCPSLELQTNSQATVIKVFRNIAKKCF